MKIIKKVSFLLFLLLLSNSIVAQKNNKAIIKTVIESYFEAIGGKEKATQIHSFSSVSSSTLNDKKIVLTKKLMLPNLFYSEMEYDGYVVSKNTFDGKKGTTMQQDVETKFSATELKRHKKNRSIFPEFDYLKTASYLGIETVDKKDCHVLEIENVKVYYAIDTGLKIKGISLQEKDGHSFLQELYFSKYIEIEGLLFPSNLLMLAGNNKIEFQTRSILINRDVSKKDFK
tara:strand:+ start:57491 stop:58180 length:690 start_codon:yes stop_codon:yes gene_type:complete